MNSGESYSRLTTARRAGSHKGRNALWECSCSCGGTALARSDRLRSGHVRSCGCLLRENRQGWKAVRAAFHRLAPGE
jgi:hypothetical protein